jgi:hypothetical protein
VIWLALITLLAIVAVAIEFATGNQSLRRVRQLPVAGPTPPVSIVVAARNEARKIQPALESLRHLDYPNLEIIVVNDRSTDETGQILSEVAGVRVITVRELPPGWLGKNHAQQVGAQAATGEWLLFTDADVHFEPSTLRRAVAYAVTAGVQHLAIAPRITMPGLWLQMFGGAFTIFFGLYAKPWKAPDPRSDRHIGIGAFNLVRADAYRAIGGHTKLAMRPDDDMKLGKALKMSGCRQEMLLGDGFVAVEWYSSVRELVRGLEKNTFAGVEYRVSVVVAATVAQLLVFVWPVVAVFVTDGVTWGLNVAAVLLLAGVYVLNAPVHGLPRWHWVAMPVTALLFLYIVWRATLLTLWRDGIDWRGTHYSLAELRANQL